MRTARFIEGDDERRERRYMETPRRHPLAGEFRSWMGSGPSAKWLLRCATRADLVIDTSPLTAADLKRPLTSPSPFGARGLRVFVTSLVRFPG